MCAKRRVVVTDHAVLRYLERIEGVDVARIRRRIEKLTRIAIDHDGASAVVVDGVRYKICDDHVVTVVPRDRTTRRRK